MPQPLPKQVTMEEAILWAETELRKSPHPGFARRDAETLLMHALSQNRAFLISHSKDLLAAQFLVHFEACIARRAVGEPIQYIVGEQEFYGLPFFVQPGILIPRPETEHLVEAALVAAAVWPKPRILDIGTGSGAIAVSIAHALPQSEVTAVDISPIALEVAARNATRNLPADRVRLLQSDLFSALPGEQFEIIASNPPYVPLADKEELSLEVRSYEPEGALFAGIDGLSIYRRLIPEAYDHLQSSGWLLLEIGYGQQQAISKLLQQAGFEKIAFLPDLQGIPRVAQAQRTTDFTS